MQPRAVRIPIYDATVMFNAKDATLVTISRTGALLRVHSPARVGSDGPIVITQNHTTIRIEATVVRSGMAPLSGRGDEGEWHAGIKFVAPPPAEITQLLRRIMALR